MRVLFFGMRGQFSLLPLRALFESEHEVVSVVLPAQRHTSGTSYELLESEPTLVSGLEIPLLSGYVEQNIVTAAWQARLPVVEVHRPDDRRFLDWVRSLAVDIACVACFSRIVPPSLLALPRHGFLNLHPSLLPDYRGPEPIFWQLRDGTNPVGVTVHWMDAGLDTGDIAAQCTLPLPDGIGSVEIERRTAQVGGALLLEVIDAVASGNAGRYPQPAGGSYQPAPTEADFTLELTWTAQCAFNFMRGTAEWGIPYRLAIAGKEIVLTEALDWSANGGSPGHVEQLGEYLNIGFAQGVLVAR
jgi:methionyl-tRNA formyltransferase